MKKIVSLGIMCSMLLLSVTFFAFRTVPKTLNKDQFSGEELFEGIYFHQGRVSEVLPELSDERQLSKTDKQQIIEFKDKMINAISKAEPAFFSEFKKRISSGNPIEIEKSLTEADKLYRSNTSVLSNGQKKGGIPVPQIGVEFIVILPPPPIYAKTIYIAGVQNRVLENLEKESLIFSIAKNLSR